MIKKLNKNKNLFAAARFLNPSQNSFNTAEPGYNNRYPEFSFKYYAHTHRDYSFKCIVDIEDFHEMFDRLKAMSGLTWYAIKKAIQFHFHEIEWASSEEPNGFTNCLPSTLRSYPACQFKLFQECRIIGFFNSTNIFEIVWVDRHHQVYKRK
jgi:hypothetical protein